MGTDFLCTLIKNFFNGEIVYKTEESPFFPKKFYIKNLSDDRFYFYDGRRGKYSA